MTGTDCEHTKWVHPTPYEHFITGEPVEQPPYKVYTQDDIDIGRFYCTQCGEIGYYTGAWKKYFEGAEPCPGSRYVDRRVPDFILELQRKYAASRI